MQLRALGRYDILAPLPVRSRGNCKFFLARHDDEPQTSEATYVAKVLTPTLGEDAAASLAAFQHQERLLSALNHPAIPTLHASGEQDGVSYLVMDRIDGIDLASLLGHEDGQPRALSKEIAVFIVAQVADALHHMHGLEFMDEHGPKTLQALHTHVTPRNVVISRMGDAVLVGFGHAQSEWLPAGSQAQASRELSYQAPETLTGAPESVHTELFSLAVMLWEMLRGERCLHGDSADAIRQNISRFDISQANRRVTGLSPKLSEVLRRNLDRDPERRSSDAYTMLQRLSQAPEAKHAQAARTSLAELVTQTMHAAAS